MIADLDSSMLPMLSTLQSINHVIYIKKNNKPLCAPFKFSMQLNHSLAETTDLTQTRLPNATMYK